MSAQPHSNNIVSLDERRSPSESWIPVGREGLLSEPTVTSPSSSTAFPLEPTAAATPSEPPTLKGLFAAFTQSAAENESSQLLGAWLEAVQRQLRGSTLNLEEMVIFILASADVYRGSERADILAFAIDCVADMGLRIPHSQMGALCLDENSAVRYVAINKASELSPELAREYFRVHYPLETEPLKSMLEPLRRRVLSINSDRRRP